MAKKNVFKPKEDKLISEKNRQWDELIKKIIQGEVVPVIGFLGTVEGTGT
jgi:hypothetical protein